MEEQINHYLEKSIPTLRAVYLFGSYADGSYTHASDVDLAFLSDAPIDALHRWELLTGLAQQLNQEVDLVDLHSASTVMQFQVVSTGKRIFAVDTTEVEWWELKVYQLYLTLNDDRRPILAAIQQSGSVYGR